MKGVAHGVDVKLVELVEELLHGVVGRLDVTLGDHNELDLGVGDVAVPAKRPRAPPPQPQHARSRGRTDAGSAVGLGRTLRAPRSGREARGRALGAAAHASVPLQPGRVVSSGLGTGGGGAGCAERGKRAHAPRSSMTSSAACTT